jgi:putative transposase
LISTVSSLLSWSKAGVTKEAAARFFKKLLTTCAYEPRVVITDKLQRYAAALETLLPHVDHRQHKGLNNRAENSHQPTRQRERQMRRFKSPDQAQQFLSAFGPIRGYFCLGRHRLRAADYRVQRRQRFASWQAIIQFGMTV